MDKKLLTSELMRVARLLIADTKLYVEAYGADGKQILGNLDGQNVIRTRNYKQTSTYKRLVSQPAEKLSLHGRVKQYKIVDDQGKVLAVIDKD